MARILKDIRKIAVIGGGCCGVATAKHLLAEKAFTKIDIFEQRSASAGIWNYDPENQVDDRFSVPKTDPESGPEPPKWRDNVSSIVGRPNGHGVTFSSAMYDRLEANLPKMMMQHSDLAFDEGTSLLPGRESIRIYLERYAKEIIPMIQFETQVLSLEMIQEPHPNGNAQSQHEIKTCGWRVTTRNLATQKEQSADYDAVLVASGKYTVSFVPDFPGIKEWNLHRPKSITHSKFYRRPEDFRDQKVLVIGTGPSGMDISMQVAQCAREVLISSTKPPKEWLVTSDLHAKVSFLPGIKSFNPSNGTIVFADDSQITGIDTVLLCTGYIYSYPFLPTKLDPPLIIHGDRVHNVYQHIFYNAIPTLAFTCLPWNIVPFPLAELQGAAIARVWGGRLALPSYDDAQAWERETEGRMGTGKSFHQMPNLLDVDYMQELDRWLIDGTQEVKGRGKEQPHWGPWERWLRGSVRDVRLAVKAMSADEKAKVTMLEQVGVDFERDVADGKVDRNTGRRLQ